MRAVIFAGPSLPPSVRPDDPRFDWRAPARQCDVYRAALERPDVIGLIDGYFDAVPSVWHKEILWAMAQGIRVYGAASIGALRAAELADFGMIGVGRIFEMFRDGVLTDDDEVALLHGPAEAGYVQLSVPMVNVRATLDAATDDGVIGEPVAKAFAQVAKSTFYKERTWKSVVRRVPGGEDSAESVARFKAWLGHGYVDRKRADASYLLSVVGQESYLQRHPIGRPYSLSRSDCWERAASRLAGQPSLTIIAKPAHHALP